MKRSKTAPHIVMASLPKRFTQTSISEALAKAPLDKKVGIRHAVLAEGKRWAYHVAEVKNIVAPHVHMHGGETYYILSGKGIMHTGLVNAGNGGVNAVWDKNLTLKVNAGDSFLIPPGYAHSLENTGDGPLLIAFRCPDSYLTDGDRIIVKNPPVYKGR